MDLQSFIQSGLLESYVLGQCSSEERALVERMIAEYPSVKAELEAIEASLERYAAAHGVTPPEGMKASILERINEEIRQTQQEKSKAKTPSNGNMLIFQALTFVLAALCAFLFFRQKDLSEQDKQNQEKIEALNRQVAEQQQQLAKPDPLLELICDASTQHLILSDGKGIHTLVYYNPRLHRMAYDPSGLPAPKNGKYYQFWAVVSGAPVSLGMKAVNICGSLTTVETPTAFAVSEEDSPNGNAAPTLILAMVTVSG